MQYRRGDFDRRTRIVLHAVGDKDELAVSRQGIADPVTARQDSLPQRVDRFDLPGRVLLEFHRRTVGHRVIDYQYRAVAIRDLIRGARLHIAGAESLALKNDFDLARLIGDLRDVRTVRIAQRIQLGLNRNAILAFERNNPVFLFDERGFNSAPPCFALPRAHLVFRSSRACQHHPYNTDHSAHDDCSPL